MMADTKSFKTYGEQLELLERRGMLIEDPEGAEELLHKVSYYRLSGYWHPMRRFNSETGASLDAFRPGASFNLVRSLYCFDEQLRLAASGELASIELAMRSLLGHELGRISALVHLDATQLGALARQPTNNRGTTNHARWLEKFQRAQGGSREDFVAHHRKNYDDLLPIWAATEIMDWGLLSHLYRISPGPARNAVASACNLTASCPSRIPGQRSGSLQAARCA